MLPLSFYSQRTDLVAQELLGMWLVHAVDGLQHVGRIVETEAYLGQHDLACHASKGRTPRTETMFGPPGHAYVYLIYGMYHCFNVVTEPEGCGSAVLIRAVEPVAGMLQDKTAGPGLLCKAMGITREQNGISLLGYRLYITEPAGGVQRGRIQRTARIGVDYAGDWARKPLRYYLADSTFISKGKPSTGKKSH
jgi:DNA-3-methyladenine glycosylase